MYYFISNSEDGLRVEGPFNEADALERIDDLTSEDVLPQYRSVFVDEVPSWNTPVEHVYIVKGENVIPQPVQRITEWTL